MAVTEPAKPGYSLDPVTFEVLKNAFVNIVDQMAEQIFRTCYSFVIYSRDFSSALCDPEGNTVMQGSGDIAAHVGTLHFTAKAVIDTFGDDINPGDVFVVNDPYHGRDALQRHAHRAPDLLRRRAARLLAGQRPLGGRRRRGARARSTSRRVDHMAEGLRITPVRVWDGDRYLADVAQLIANNTRAPAGHHRRHAGPGRGHSRRRARDPAPVRQIRGRRPSSTAFAEVQDYVEQLTRASDRRRCRTAPGRPRTTSTRTRRSARA